MSHSEKIICKPTSWFILRALAMLAMFGTFTFLFFKDGTTGYRQKNYEYYLKTTFDTASSKFSSMNSEGSLTADKWNEFASSQTVAFPEDASTLPTDLKLPMKWPEVLTDFERVKPLQPHLLWKEYSGKHKLKHDVEEKPFDARKIREQFTFLYICALFTLITIFFLVRTSFRSISADENALTTANGKRIAYSDMKTLDLRKWDTKGLAVIEYSHASGMKRARIDGLTYGGFKKEHNEPAETLMQMIRSRFSGEIIEYSIIETDAENPHAEADKPSDK